jgi:hypothetical protein
LKERTKTVLTTMLLLMALFQGPFFYYWSEDFTTLFFAIPFGLFGLILSIILLVQIVVNRSPNTKYHIFGLGLTFVIGISTILPGTLMEYLDFYIRKSERNKIVEDVKKGKTYQVSSASSYFVADNGNDFDIIENKGQMVTVEFYTYRGLLDHSTGFVYTNIPSEISDLEGKIGNSDNDTTVKKLDDNWYKVVY